VTGIVASSGDRLTVVFFDWSVQLMLLVEKSGGAWGSVVSLTNSTFFPDRRNVRLETSTTGAHPTLALFTDSGLQIGRPSDGWTLHQLTGAFTILGIGYDAQDHLYVLLQGGWDFSEKTYVALFREK